MDTRAGMKRIAREIARVNKLYVTEQPRLDAYEAVLTREFGEVLRDADDVVEVHGEKHPTSVIHKLAASLEKVMREA